VTRSLRCVTQVTAVSFTNADIQSIRKSHEQKEGP
jgi:hypothetical protein